MRTGLLEIGLVLLILGVIFYVSPEPEWFNGAQATTVWMMVVGAIFMILWLVLPDPVRTKPRGRSE